MINRTTKITRAFTPKKLILSGVDKVSERVLAPKNPDSLLQWIELYFHIHVKGSPERTVNAKKKDLSKFLEFYFPFNKLFVFS